MRLWAFLLPILLCCGLPVGSAPRVAQDRAQDKIQEREPDKVETWEVLDKRLKQRVYQVNVGIRGRVGSSFCHLSDLSPRHRFPVFATTGDDVGFRVVGSGSCFPIQALATDRTYFLTNRHVVEAGEGINKECERFFAAARLHAEQTAGLQDPQTRYKSILDIVNLSLKKDMNFVEKTMYSSTADAIWDTYESHLSLKADPSRQQFNKYRGLSGVACESGYYLHPAGPVSFPALEARLVKAARSENEPDLAILAVADPLIAKLEFDSQEPSEGQEIQVIGYPLASDQIDFDSGAYYAPTFSTGRISRVAPRLLQVDAPVTVGNSGGPVVSQRGKVLGVIVRRASVQQKLGQAVIQTELPNFGGAITVRTIKSFAPELFGQQ